MGLYLRTGKAAATYGFESEVEVSSFEEIAREAVQKGERVLDFAERFMSRSS